MPEKIKKTKSLEIKKDASGAFKFLIEPWITEKSHDFLAQNKYIFRVAKSADKKKIKQTIENVYGVTVKKVNIVIIHPKKRMYGRKEGVKPGYKKAIITLKEGDKIELFEGV